MSARFWVIFSSITILGLNTLLNATAIAIDDTHGDSECTRRKDYIAELSLNTRIIFPPSLTGKWVSERCETRPGPEYILRSYTFHSNNSFYLLQFYFSDHSCSSVTHTVSARGTYRFKDRPLYKLLYEITKVTITVHDSRFLDTLSNTIVNGYCSAIADVYWRLFREYVIFERANKDETRNKIESNKASKTSRAHEKSAKQLDIDMKCLSLINISFDELHTLRVQSRPSPSDDDGEEALKYELLLDNTHHHHQEKKRNPSLLKFQPPLVLLNGTNSGCLICSIVSKNTNMFVKHLPAKPILPLFLNGQWMSKTCELRVMGLYSMRAFRVNQYSGEWELETTYYFDYACSNEMMVHSSIGRYYQGNPSTKVSGAFEMEFEIQKSYLTVMSEAILDTIETDPRCGVPHYWNIGVKKEIPSRYGCASVDITYPFVKYDIASVDVDFDGSYLLYLGDEGSGSNEHSELILNRPTSYEYPLVQCSSAPYPFPRKPETPSSALSLGPSLLAITLGLGQLICNRVIFE